MQAVNVLRADSVLERAEWPARLAPSWQVEDTQQEFGPWVLALALALGALDVLLTLWLAGTVVADRAAGSLQEWSRALCWLLRRSLSMPRPTRRPVS